MNNQKKILILSAEFPPGPGGIGTHAYEISRHLSLLGWNVHVAACQDYASPEEISNFNRGCNFKINTLESGGAPLIYLIKRWFTIKKIISKFKPDCILATGDRILYLAAAVSENIPWVGVEHGRIISGVEGFIKKWAFKRSPYIVFVSEYTKSKNLNAGFIPRQSMVIPNGADENFFKVLSEQELSGFKKLYGINEEMKILLTVGNVTERKGQEIVIRALPEIVKKYSNIIYLMVGLPTLQNELAEIAGKLGIKKHICFMGKVDKQTLLRAMNACDIFLMTSRQSLKGDFEGYGIAAVEAALCGKPAVVTNDSGLSEAIQEGLTGYGVAQNDIVSVAEKTLQMLDNDDLRKRMGQAARQRALSEQTWKIRGRMFHELLVSMVGKK